MQPGNCVIGIDIGGTTTSFGFVDRNGILLNEVIIPTKADQSAGYLVSRICSSINNSETSLDGRAVIAGIGIGAPNANYYRGTVENPVNLAWGASVNLVELFQKHFDVPVAVTNDANAAAIGELKFGGAKEMKHIIVITLGTGLGSGIVVNGELLYGADGFAGELGHTTVEPGGRLCACGKQGCLETYVSATGLCKTVVRLLSEKSGATVLRDINADQLTSKLIYEAACSGDLLALEAFDVTARVLGMKLADAVAHTSPEAIFLSGGLAAAGDLLIKPTQRYFEDFLFTPYKGKIKLLQSELPEGKGAILGAAALAWHEVEKLTEVVMPL